jgi:ABC-2 type transport system permease protein
LLGSSDEEIFDFSAMIPKLRENAKILYFIGSASLLSPIPILIALVVSVGAALIAYTAISHNYIKIISETSGTASKAYKAERLKSGSALSALVKKELRYLISNANYILNSCLGIVFMLVIAVVALFKREVVISICEELFGVQGAVAGVFSAGIIITLSMCTMSACALSLEGKRLWILKSIPVSSKVAVLSKALPQVIITVPVSIISVIIITFATGAEFYFYPIAIISVSAACVFYAFFGTILNVLFPKFEYENEVQPIKQSLSVFLAMIINMVMSLAVVFVSGILAFVSPLLSALSVALIYTFLAVIVGLILLGPAAKKYEAL